MPVDRLRPRYSLRSMACLLRIAPSSYHYHHARIGVDKYAGLRARVARAFADSKGRYGYRRVCVLASWRPLCERCFSAV